MKYLKKFNENLKSDIDSICKKYNITNYTINIDGSIDVDGNVNLSYKNLTKLPLTFNKVSGNFYCYINELITLKGSPKEVFGHFSCSQNRLTLLEGGPAKVGGGFYCSFNKLTTLEGSPKEVFGYFDCRNNQLTTLEGGPIKVGGHFDCEGNPLPDVILNSKYLKKILIEGDDFYIWKKGKLDMSSFEYMIDVFKDEE